MVYDVVVVGGGPAGLSAGIYAKRAGRNVLVIEKFLPGGQLNLIGQIENYLGFSSVSGSELAEKFTDHALSQGLQIITDEVIDYDLDGQIKTLSLRKGQVQLRQLYYLKVAFQENLALKAKRNTRAEASVIAHYVMAISLKENLSLLLAQVTLHSQMQSIFQTFASKFTFSQSQL